MYAITIHQRYRRTDGQTTFHGNTAICIASGSKKYDTIVDFNVDSKAEY